MRSKKSFYAFVTSALVLVTAVAAQAQGTVTITITSSGSSITTSTGTFPVGSASLVAACSPDGSGGFTFDFGDGSASRFDPIQIPTTNLTAQFLACNPLGTGAQDASGLNSATLSVQVQLTGSLLADVGPNCKTGCVSAPLADPAPMSGTATVTADQVFTDCNTQEAFINQLFGVPGDVRVTFNETADTSACQ
ncbi:MAG TPA: hypothetical protein VEM39_10845 [Myxococcaceae bacterium]|nr:hypothetical protein [Myxococcaceae bacterium]